MDEIKRISADPIKPFVYLRRLWQYRGLVKILIYRDFKSAYAQTKLGWLWLVLKPLTVLAVFTVFFDQLLAIDTDHTPYPVFAFCGMSLWYFFSTIVHSTSQAFLESSDLIKKIYFPKLVLLLSKSLYATFELIAHLLMLFILLIAYGYFPNVGWLMVLPAVGFTYLFGLTIGVWLNNLTIRNRDMQHFITQIVNVAIWLTPVFYPLSIVPDAYEHWAYTLNPMAVYIDLLRYGVLNLEFNVWVALTNVLVIAIVLLVGILTFIRKERNLVDTV